ncbi:MAG: EVE domain-containing protein [Acidobacteriota bacterium]
MPVNARWLFKTEPSDYSYQRLSREGRTAWDGVNNALALKHLRQVRRGDSILIYHTGNEKAVIGIARAVGDSYPDPRDRSGKQVIVDVEPDRELRRPVTLAELKARRDLADFDLVRLGRLSVMPVSRERWEIILGLSRGAPAAARPSRQAGRKSARRATGRARRRNSPTPV